MGVQVPPSTPVIRFRRVLALLAAIQLLFGWVAVAAEVDHDPTPVQPYVVGGSLADGLWAPVVARILGDDGSLCTGVFISPQWVATAGHCVSATGRAEIFSGSTAVSSLVSRGGASGRSHPYFSITSLSIRYDFGLYQLDAPAPIDAASIPSVASYDDTWAWRTGAPVTVLGWGRTTAGGAVSATLQSGNLSVVADSECATLDLSLGNVYDSSTALCAIAPATFACNGDSGGPVVALGTDGRYRVVGLTSYGPVGCNGHSVSAWVPSGLAWMRSVTGLQLGGGSAITGGLQVTRIFGADRYETAAAVSADWRTTDEVFIATGAKFPDALAAGAAASRFGAPVLLVDANGVPSSTRLELQRLAPSKVYVAGGTAAVSAAVFDQLRSVVTGEVIRVGGIDRYDTARQFTQTAWVGRTSPVVWVASGRDFADPLIASTAAAVYGRPFVLVDGLAPLPEATRQLIASLAPSTIRTVGPPATFSASLVTSLKAIANVLPIDAADVSDRSAAVWEGLSISKWAALATAANFPDALAAVPFSSLDPVSPLMLVPSNCVPGTVRSQIARLGVDSLAIFGGPAALAEPIESLASC
ncbi:MAG: hypothetical protein B7C54_09310 [Acidimicrobiales bacterium mtb01]|nr:trypsin-like serine protease [Actinomycetota bacterium]TEX45294.1 MAG: hypothetical protein B7C54_09310 [Acidimicrobiales bacterium mtb01]